MQTKPSYPIDSASIPGCGPNLHPEKAYLRWYNYIKNFNFQLFPLPNSTINQSSIIDIPWLPPQLMEMDTHENNNESTITPDISSNPSQLYKCLGIVVTRREHGKNLFFLNFELWDTKDIQQYELLYNQTYPSNNTTSINTPFDTFETNKPLRMDNISSKPLSVIQIKIVTDNHTKKLANPIDTNTTNTIELINHFIQNTPIDNKVIQYIQSSKLYDTLAYHLYYCRPGSVILGIGNIEQIPNKNHKDFNIHYLQILQIRPDPIYIHSLLSYLHNIQYYQEQYSLYLQNYINQYMIPENNSIPNVTNPINTTEITHTPLLLVHLQNKQLYKLIYIYIAQVLNCTNDTIDKLIEWLRINGKDYEEQLKKEEQQVPETNSNNKSSTKEKGKSKKVKSKDQSKAINETADIKLEEPAKDKGILNANTDIDEAELDDLDTTITTGASSTIKFNYHLSLVRICRNINNKSLVRLTGMSHRTISKEETILLQTLETFVETHSYYTASKSNDKNNTFRLSLADDEHGKFLLPIPDNHSFDNSSMQEQIQQVIDKVHPRENLPEFSILQHNKEYNATVYLSSINNPSSTPQKRYRYIENKKIPQIEIFLQNLYRIFSYKHSITGSNFKHAVDIGGGRGDLALAVAVCFPNLYITVIDINQSSLDAGKYRAQQLNLTNIRFIHGDVRNVYNLLSQPWEKLQFSQSLSPMSTSADEVTSSNMEYYPPDLFIGLHTCGLLTDWIMYLISYYSASCIVCPCCFCKHRDLQVSLLSTLTASHTNIDSPIDSIQYETFIEQSLSNLYTLQRLADATESQLRAIAIRAMRIINILRVYKLHKLINNTKKANTSYTNNQSSNESDTYGLGSFSHHHSLKNQLIIYIKS